MSFRRKAGSVQQACTSNPDVEISSFESAQFDKIDNSHLQAKSVKPSIHNALGYISSGHKQLDELLGGGLQLGSIFLLGVDTFSNHGDVLLSYGIAESLSMGQDTLVLAADRCQADSIISLLPYNRTIGSKLNDGVKIENHSQGEKSTIKNEEKLNVAWQYGKYIKQEEERETKRREKTESSKNGKTSMSKQFCCSYDLGRRLQNGIFAVNSNKFNIFHPDMNSNDSIFARSAITLQSALNSYLKTIQSFLNNLRTKPCAGRIILYEFHQIVSSYGENCPVTQQIDCAAQFLLQLRVLVRSLPVSVVLTVLPSAWPKRNPDKKSVNTEINDTIDSKLLSLSDYAVALDSFSGHETSVPQEFASFHGFVTIEKVTHLGCLMPNKPSSKGFRFGLKRDRRKLHIEPLHLPPEESRAFGDAGTDARLERRASEVKNNSSNIFIDSTTNKLVVEVKTNKSSPNLEKKIATITQEPDISIKNTIDVVESKESEEAKVVGYRKLNLGGNRTMSNSKMSGAISISSFRNKGLAEGKKIPNKSNNLDF